MKASPSTLASLSDMTTVKTQGDLRRIVGNSLLALARKEISALDVVSMAKGLEAISNSMNAEIKVAKAAAEIRATGGSLGAIHQLGSLPIGAE